MTIQLSAEGERVVRALVEGGEYPSEGEVIEEALRLLRDRDDRARLAELRREIAIGIEQADRGELAPFDPLATLERVRSRSAADAGHA